ncbi:imelysin family protein [Pseudomonas neustonica]|uniref:Peptidase n=1 Tax=Pseudomonas neustonica TaxID=2487346 RepID=A0ABX9XIH8_9PSED|nr:MULTISPECIES: imelysin family protein [Pseudomonas]ROZ83281.1 peptidase [Pseudomonas sp. SSM44]ROZ85190.1 peptidase [Pseudomonas neustonica]|tara:strand:+ start:5036 stop:6391 length:1356 start_codon:yes stop_codon:yes gene_type:complete
MAVRFPLQALALAISTSFLLTACSDENKTAQPDAPEQAATAPSESAEKPTTDSTVSPEAVVSHYADLAHATFEDALITAKALDAATDALIENPTAENLAAAKQAWLAARVPYQQSEVFRFGNAVIDDWEGQLNAWPLDEGLIDYVKAEGYQHALGNDGANANIIANTELNIGGETMDLSTLTPDLLASLNEVGGSEANVATGYHAIEFLLWGQDMHGFAAGAGERPASDYAKGDDCTNGHCDRRAAYLDAVTDLLVTDLQWMVGQWSADTEGNYRAEFVAIEPQVAYQKMLFGMGSLSLGELAGERMKVALEANSYEDEHDCFSDNTHNSHYYNGKGIQNVYTGTYLRVDGTELTGASLSDLVANNDAQLDQKLTAELDSTMAALGEMKTRAEASENPVKFDMMIAPDNAEGAKVINDAIAALVEQTGSIEKVAAIVGVDSLQPDDAGHSF